MQKDFIRWNSLKAVLEEKESHALFHIREIWLCSLGLNLGHEQDGKGNKFLRPVLVFKKFNNDTFWGIPLTSKQRDDRYHYQLRFALRPSSVILSQLRLMDRKRLFAKVGVLSYEEFRVLKMKVVRMMIK